MRSGGEAAPVLSKRFLLRRKRTPFFIHSLSGPQGLKIGNRCRDQERLHIGFLKHQKSRQVDDAARVTREAPFAGTTRWLGIMIEIGFWLIMPPTACGEGRKPVRCAATRFPISAYVAVVP